MPQKRAKRPAQHVGMSGRVADGEGTTLQELPRIPLRELQHHQLQHAPKANFEVASLTTESAPADEVGPGGAGVPPPADPGLAPATGEHAPASNRKDDAIWNARIKTTNSGEKKYG